MALVFNANLDIKGNATLASDKDIFLSGGGEVIGLPASPSGVTAAASKAYVDAQISGITGVLHFKGGLDAGTLAAQLDDSEAGDYFIVTAPGTIFSSNPVELATGDHLVCTSTVVGTPDDGASWSKVDNTEAADIIRTSSSVTALSDVTNAGSGIIISAAERSKLAGIEANATADQTGAEIKAAYEAEANTNAYTDAEVTLVANALQPADNVSELTNDAGYLVAADFPQSFVGSATTASSDIVHSFGMASNFNYLQIEMRDSVTGESVFADSIGSYTANQFTITFASVPANAVNVFVREIS